MVELTNLNYLASEQLMFQNDITLLQLRDCTLNFPSKNSSEAISEMFLTELKFTADCLLRLFKKKIKSNNLELSNEQKIKYETQNPIYWEKDHCCICPFPLQINPTNMINMKNTKNISYRNFYIVKEHKFWGVLLREEELKMFKNLKVLDNYFIALSFKNCHLFTKCPRSL